jgi:endonuclease/exonuclease/phosphatase family metal-dependent hydrolase
VAITGAWFRSLEVAILSRTPIRFAGEWDPTGREPMGDGFAPRLVADADVDAAELPIDIEIGEELDIPDRGFLRVDLENDLAVYAAHWKSSRGEACNAADRANAAQREAQALAIVQDAERMLAEGRTVVVMGDFNIQAPGRAPRVGFDAAVDCAPVGVCDGVCGPGGADGYDDSIAILLELDPSARLLSAELDATFLTRFFPGGAIDHIAVAGPRAAAFAMARAPTADESFFGSDHRPVLAAIAARTPEEAEGAELRRLIEEVRERLERMEALIAR